MASSSAGRDPETYAIIGAAMEVHRELGCGFFEPVYQEALQLELTRRCVPFQPQVDLAIEYKGQHLRTRYRADLICFDRVIVELKALKLLGDAESAQVLNYLKASGLSRGLLLNFGARSLEYRRLVLGDPRIDRQDGQCHRP